MIDPAGGHWVRFAVRRVPVTEDRPHGLSYSLTLHGATGERLVGIDNAHPVREAGGRSKRAPTGRDHRHRLRIVRPYEYRDAATLLEDFWREVEAVLKECGVGP